MEPGLAPIVLFVYNRPWHTYQTLNALAANYLADQSDLYVFADGPKKNASRDILQKITEVRKIIKERNWCGDVKIIESERNKGLADSVIFGVTQILNQYEKVIVLEDDIVASKGFLKYMNDALNLYFDDCQVGCVHAWNYNLNISNYNESTFFLRGADCWGWGTWKRAWAEFNYDGKKLLKTIETENIEYEFNRKGTHDFIEMLKNQIEGKNDSWAIRWHASLFIKNMYCLHPTRPIVKNIGLDMTGVHCGISNLIQIPTDFIDINKIPIQELDWFFDAYSNLIKEKTNESFS